MDSAASPARDNAGPRLFRQIAIRLAFLTLIFAILNIAIVVITYSRQPESLSQELLSLEADRIAETPDASAANRGPLGSRHWKFR